MSDVLEFAGVSVVRADNTLLDDITWEVEEGQRWVILGPNGAGKTTLLQLAAGRIHPTTGVAGVLGEVLGVVDVFELRPRIGLCSAAIAERLPGDELVKDVVVTASYGIVGRWRESYDALDHARAADLLDALGVAHLAERAFGTLSEGERKRVQIARAGQCHQDGPLTQITPQTQAVDVAGDMVEVGVGSVDHILDPQLPGIGRRRPQGEPDAHGQSGHQLIVGVADPDALAVA